eukprot:415642_1
MFLMQLLFVMVYSQLPPSPPLFSWDTVPLFMHAMNATGALNDTAAAYMATFPLVTVEKSQGQDMNNPVCNTTQEPCEEDMIIAACKKIKSYNSSTRTMFYLNTMYNLPQYRLSTNFYGENSKYLLHDQSGNLVHGCNKNTNHTTIFDLSQNETIQFWLNTVEYAMTHQPMAVDGIFADTCRGKTSQDLKCVNMSQQKANEWDNGHIQMVKDAMRIVKKYNNDRGIIICNNDDIDTVNGRMFEQLRINDTSGVPQGNDLEILMRENGVRITEPHKDKCFPGSDVYNQSLAVYLIGAYEYSYYGCTEGWTIQEGWDIIWQNKDYFKELGKPLMNATFNNLTQIYYREFDKGVKVWLDYLWKYPCIKWNDGSITGNKTDCDEYF